MQLQLSAEQLLATGGYHQGMQPMVSDQPATMHTDQQQPHHQDMVHVSEGIEQPQPPMSTAP